MSEMQSVKYHGFHSRGSDSKAWFQTVMMKWLQRWAKGEDPEKKVAEQKEHLSAYKMPGTVLGTEDISEQKRWWLSLLPVGKTNKGLINTQVPDREHILKKQKGKKW